MSTKSKSAKNLDRYATTDFARWATNRRELYSAERWLIEKHLSKEANTLEAGTGGGSILYAMRDMGFTSLTGYDNVPEMVQAARSGDPAGDITFDVQDATDLDYANESFDQVVYLQWLLSLVEGEEARVTALREAHRVLRPGGVALFCVPSRETRERRPAIKAMGTWLRAIRTLRRSKRSPSDWPHMLVGGRRNYGAFLDRGPYLHWFTFEEAGTLLEREGFTILFSGREQEVTALAGGEVSRGAAGLYFVGSKH
jgi:SAM-dependent methyltransferase